MKTYEQLLPKFSSEPGLEYREMYVYPNNSIYRGQMKKKDAFTDLRMSHSHDSNLANDEQGIHEYRHGYGI